MARSMIPSATLTALALTLLVGCGGSDDVFNGNTGPNQVLNRSGSLEMTLTSDKYAYAIGEPVELTFTVKNVGPDPQRFDFSSSQQYDFESHDARELRWNWAHDQNFLGVLTSFTLQPGESWVRSVTWDQHDNSGQQVAPGDYRLRARLTTAGSYVTGYLPIRIE